jgi:hypothetical protein
MQVGVPVPSTTRVSDVKVALVGRRKLEVVVGPQSLCVELPADGDPAACTARLVGTDGEEAGEGKVAELTITVGVLDQGAVYAASPVEPAPAAAAASAAARASTQRRRSSRAADAQQRRVRRAEAAEAMRAVAVRIAAGGRALGEARARAASEAEAAEARSGQLSRLSQMLGMPAAQLGQMAAQIGMASAEAFVAKMQKQLAPLKTQVACHEQAAEGARKEVRRLEKEHARHVAERTALEKKAEADAEAEADEGEEPESEAQGQRQKEQQELAAAPVGDRHEEDAVCFVDGRGLGALPPPPRLPDGEATAASVAAADQQRRSSSSSQQGQQAKSAPSAAAVAVAERVVAALGTQFGLPLLTSLPLSLSSSLAQLQLTRGTVLENSYISTAITPELTVYPGRVAWQGKTAGRCATALRIASWYAAARTPGDVRTPR